MKIRKYFGHDKKITISNICLAIPNEIIQNELSNIGINPSRQIIHLRAGIKKKDKRTSGNSKDKCMFSQKPP